MQFLGSVRLDGSKRITLIKEVAEILELGPQDHVMFYIDNGEVILRRVLPESSKGGIATTTTVSGSGPGRGRSRSV